MCTPTAGTEELLPGPDYGTLLPDTAPETIRAALAEMQARPDAARARAQKARQHLAGHFTWDAVFATIKAIAAEAADR